MLIVNYIQPAVNNNYISLLNVAKYINIWIVCVITNQ